MTISSLPIHILDDLRVLRDHPHSRLRGPPISGTSNHLARWAKSLIGVGWGCRHYCHDQNFLIAQSLSFPEIRQSRVARQFMSTWVSYYGPRITDVTTNLVVLYVRGREVAPQLDEADIMTVKAMYLL
jgi:hypothetical protein